MTDVDLAEWQMDVGGVLLGPGTSVRVADVEGLGMVETRAQDAENPLGDGGLVGVDWYGAREVRVTAGIATPGDPGAALDVLARLQEVADDPAVRLVPGATTSLRLRWPGRGPRRVFGRLREVEAGMERVGAGWIPLDLLFVAVDPLIYDDRESALVLRLSAAGLGGLRAPIVAPVTTGVAVPDERRGWVVNGGRRPAWPTVRITGPCTGPLITHSESGRVIDLSGLHVPAGERVEVATRPGTRWVRRESGGLADLGSVPPPPLHEFRIPPGRSEIRWTARDYTADTRCEVTWRAPWPSL
ncbi:hypothetical protein ACN20G_33395 (plasmid) [Streptomyces sp. BI20]|uniref:hypothetical protein n=1 Tax=Streptomyces sp. BI20 TaxID=3403460 RepID=UPI003C70F13F